MRRALPPKSAGPTRFTLASTDFRGVALYVRAGLRPQWPNVMFKARASALAALATADVAGTAAHSGDPALIRWDAAVGGRERAGDHRHWVDEEGGIPLWFRRGEAVIGYGYARRRTTPGNASLLRPRHVQQQGPVLRLDVPGPGPHPSLAPTLAPDTRAASRPAAPSERGRSRSNRLTGAERRGRPGGACRRHKGWGLSLILTFSLAP